MFNTGYRLKGEGAAYPEKGKGRNPGQDATHEQNDSRNSTRETSRETERERGLFLPLAWADLAKSVKPQPFRGKSKRKSRQAVINAKRGHQGNVDAGLAGLIVLASVAALMLMGV